MSSPARFIVLEGPDGSGTTRHSEMLCERMKREGFKVLWTAEPTDGAIGRHIRSMLNEDKTAPPDAVQLLFCADRAEHVSSVILPALREGTHVVCDRFALSTIVYGAALGLDKEWLRSVNAPFPSPDLQILALPPFDVCKERIMRREHRDQYENEEFQQKVYDEYVREKGDSMILDTSEDLKTTAEDLWKRVAPLL